ncbi:MAG: hypothetical protein QG638_2419, partial [Pseudomonadota bacterium]|nr:hypothetical protein [Pseudomonadota bacterium]
FCRNTYNARSEVGGDQALIQGCLGQRTILPRAHVPVRSRCMDILEMPYESLSLRKTANVHDQRNFSAQHPTFCPYLISIGNSPGQPRRSSVCGANLTGDKRSASVLPRTSDLRPEVAVDLLVSGTALQHQLTVCRADDWQHSARICLSPTLRSCHSKV